MAVLSQSVQRLASGWIVRGSYPGVGGNFDAAQDGLVGHPASYTRRTRSFSGVKRPEGGANQPLPRAGL